MPIGDPKRVRSESLALIIFRIPPDRFLPPLPLSLRLSFPYSTCPSPPCLPSLCQCRNAVALEALPPACALALCTVPQNHFQHALGSGLRLSVNKGTLFTTPDRIAHTQCYEPAAVALRSPSPRAKGSRRRPLFPLQTTVPPHFSSARDQEDRGPFTGRAATPWDIRRGEFSCFTSAVEARYGRRLGDAFIVWRSISPELYILCGTPADFRFAVTSKVFAIFLEFSWCLQV